MKNPLQQTASRQYPDMKGHFGIYGGRYVPETVIPALEELEEKYLSLKDDPAFKEELGSLLGDYAGRPTPLYHAKRLSHALGGQKIYLKREDLTHTGAHKINNTLGQILLARKMGKKRIIAETGAGQHGVATATVAALYGLDCTIYMGEKDIKRQRLNVFRMELLGAKVICVSAGSQTLKEAVSEAIRDWITNVENTFYVLGSSVGPHPYPMIVRDFQSVIGKEVKEQIREKEGRLPQALVACVGGGSNAIGLFHPFIPDREVRLIGVEGGGAGNEKNASTLRFGYPGVLHGAKSYLLQTEGGQVAETHSVAAGLDYPGVGPEHSFLKDSKRAEYYSVDDNEAIEAFITLSQTEGLIPALESAHAVAWLIKNAEKFQRDDIIVINLSGRGDKDVALIEEILKGHRR